ncbi:MAG: hypothetical protein ACRERD_10935 [Candidatus Binatia bacterium]
MNTIGISLLIALWCGSGISGCFAKGQRATLTLPAPPALSSEEVAQQGETMARPRAFDGIRFGLPPATLAVLTDKVAQDMGWKEHFILRSKGEENYMVVFSEGKTLGVRRQVRITPQASGSAVFVFPPDEGIAARVKEQVSIYLTNPANGEGPENPGVMHFSQSFSEVWRAAKLTVIDGGFSLKTVDDEVGFIETERVPLGKASRSWFRGTGEVALIARPSAMRYTYTSVEWRYRIRVEAVTATAAQVTVETIVEAKPDSSSALKYLSKGAVDLLSMPFGSLISSTTNRDGPARLVLPSRGKLEKEFFAGLQERLYEEAKDNTPDEKRRSVKNGAPRSKTRGSKVPISALSRRAFSFSSPLFVETKE